MLSKIFACSPDDEPSLNKKAESNRVFFCSTILRKSHKFQSHYYWGTMLRSHHCGKIGKLILQSHMIPVLYICSLSAEICLICGMVLNFILFGCSKMSPCDKCSLPAGCCNFVLNKAHLCVHRTKLRHHQRVPITPPYLLISSSWHMASDLDFGVSENNEEVLHPSCPLKHMAAPRFVCF